ncbi:unnamed protein product [Rangifer tarandus platyrhynchus]|uniref:Uncharacterized protein n=2 Tax=Rangifer tarandus platyrhynchus TaxID=3082113 RepID=A0AC59Y9U0_RANTA|nr:unnamed protein product [Rangifer tarandus platyrhynchus]
MLTPCLTWLLLNSALHTSALPMWTDCFPGTPNSPRLRAFILAVPLTQWFSSPPSVGYSTTLLTAVTLWTPDAVDLFMFRVSTSTEGLAGGTFLFPLLYSLLTPRTALTTGMTYHKHTLLRG